MSMLNAATAHHMKLGSDFEVLNAAVAPFYKQLNTLGIYDSRRRRAAQTTLAKLNELLEVRKQADAAKPSALASFIRPRKSKPQPSPQQNESAFIRANPRLNASARGPR